MKKFLKYAGIGLLSLLLLAFLTPVLFKGRIIRLVKTEINKNIEARVDFKEVNLSLFRHFPQLSIGLENISVTGVGTFEKDTLLAAARIDASVNLWSVIRGSDVTVSGVYLQSPRIHALVHKDGKANWEITKEDTAVSNGGEASTLKIKLEKYAISKGYIFYQDETSDLQMEMADVDHDGSGDITADVFTLATKTKAASASFSYGGIPYLVSARTGLNASIVIDNSKSRYSFNNADIEVNHLKLTADGFFQMENDSTYSMDMKFAAPSGQFKDFLSLVPAIYKTDFEQLKTSGTASFSGFVKGSYSPTQLPAYSVDLDVKDGFFQYSDLPQPVKNINIGMRVSNPDGIMDHTVVDISRGHVEMGAEPFDFKLLFRNPETSKYIDAAVKGNLNLSSLGRFIKLEPGTKLAGLVSADVFAKGSLSAVEKQNADFSAGGFLGISQLYYASASFPQPIQNGNFKIEIRNSGGMADGTVVNISEGHIELGKDPLDFSLHLSQLLSAVRFDGAARGSFTLDHIQQFAPLEPGSSLSGSISADLRFSGSKADIDANKYEQVNTTGTVQLSKVNYVSKEYPGGILVQSAQLKFSPGTVALTNFDGRFQNTHFTADGVLNQVIGYALHQQELKGSIHLAADRIDLNEWMGTTDTASLATGDSISAPFAVPANVDLMLHAKADAVDYDKVSYNNVSGSLAIKDETVRLQNVQAEALDGTISMDGSYSTKQNRTSPAISLSYHVKDVDIQKAFYAYNTIQKLMPAGRFLSGKFSSQFNMVGKLDGQMFPDLGSLTGNGTLLLVEGALRKFQPLDKLAATLDINELRDISLKDVKSQFEFANGKMLVKPFHLKVKDIEMQIGGMHGFDQSMDYIIGMKVPRRYLGANGNALVNNLAAKAGSQGIAVTIPDMVDLNVKMGGTITSPVIKTDLKQAAGDVSRELKQQATAFVQQKAGETKQTLKDSATAIKNQVVNEAKKELVKQLTGTKDSAGTSSLQDTKQKTVETVKNTLGGLLRKKKPADSTKRGQ